MKQYIEDEKVLLAICGGYQLLGKHYISPNGQVQGLGILDIYTEGGEKRLIGNTVIYNEDFDETYVGFENHSGRTFINGLKPLGKCIHGYATMVKMVMKYVSIKILSALITMDHYFQKI